MKKLLTCLLAVVMVLSMAACSGNSGKEESGTPAEGGETEEKIRMRMEKAHTEIAVAGEYEYLVLNETGKQEECAENLLAILKAAHLTYPRMRHITDHYFD